MIVSLRESPSQASKLVIIYIVKIKLSRSVVVELHQNYMYAFQGKTSQNETNSPRMALSDHLLNLVCALSGDAATVAWGIALIDAAHR